MEQLLELLAQTDLTATIRKHRTLEGLFVIVIGNRPNGGAAITHVVTKDGLGALVEEIALEMGLVLCG